MNMTVAKRKKRMKRRGGGAGAGGGGEEEEEEEEKKEAKKKEEDKQENSNCTTTMWQQVALHILTISGTENNFNKREEGVTIDHLGTSYDYGSVMHYGAYGFAVDPSIPTIIPKDPDAEIGQRVKLSELDIERVQILYQCLDPVCRLILFPFYANFLFPNSLF